MWYEQIYVIYNNYIVPNNLNKLILSKGHASLGLYVILEKFNFLSKEELNDFCTFDSLIGGHPTIKINGVEASTGSLGHGMPIAVGMAIGKKIKQEDGRIMVIIGDGEANEGTIWESALLAAHHKLDNLICLLDDNHTTDRAVNISNVVEKFTSFGWDCLEVDGHNIEEIESALHTKQTTAPQFILCNTIKGKGVEIMEGNPEWHHKTPTVEQYNAIVQQILNS